MQSDSVEIGTKVTNLNWKTQIQLSILTGLLFITFFSILDYLFDGQLKSLTRYAVIGVSFGLIMGLALPYFLKKYGAKIATKIGKTIIPELTENERVEIKGPANVFRGMESVGGYLFLTNKKMIFKSHKINIQTGQTDIDYKSIEDLSERKTAKLIDNGIRVKTKDGIEFDFIVNQREIWINKISERIVAV